MPDDVYERDVFLWSEQQAALMRRLAEGERVNADIDWRNLIDEVESVGSSQLRACESYLRQALVHLLKMAAWPNGPVAHWRGETTGFLSDLQDRFTPSMRQHIDMQRLYKLACRQVQAGVPSDVAAPRLPPECPVVLNELLSDDLELPALIDLTERFAS